MTLKPGDPAPELELEDHTGKTWSLTDLSGRKAVLFFYPADDTPGCTAEACDFRDSMESFSGHGYQVLGINFADAASHAHFADKHALNFPLLVDPDASVAKAYGAWGEKTTFGNTYEGILRSTFVIAEDGTISYAGYNVPSKGHVAKLKADLGL